MRSGSCSAMAPGSATAGITDSSTSISWRICTSAASRGRAALERDREAPADARAAGRGPPGLVAAPHREAEALHEVNPHIAEEPDAERVRVGHVGHLDDRRHVDA